MNFLERRIKFQILQEKANHINNRLEEIADQNDLSEFEAFAEYSRILSQTKQESVDKQFASISGNTHNQLINSICSSGFQFPQPPISITKSQYQQIEDNIHKIELQQKSNPEIKKQLEEEAQAAKEEEEKRVYYMFKKDHYKQLVEENKIEDQYLSSNQKQFDRENSAFCRNNKIYFHKKNVMIEFANERIKNQHTLRK